MKTNEETIFDELMRQKLGAYSESPDMAMMNTIHAKKDRIIKLYRLAKLISVICVAGLTFVGSYLLFQPAEIVITNQNTNTILPYFGYAAADFTSTISSESAEKVNLSSLFTLQNSLEMHEDCSTSSKNKASILAYPQVKTNEINLSKRTLPTVGHSLKTEDLARDNKPIETVHEATQKQTSKSVGSSCKAAFDYYMSYDGQINFTNFSEANRSALILWDFGDGSFSDTYSPTHAYKRAGNFVVTLQISDPANSCSSSIKKNLASGDEGNTQKLGVSIKGRVMSGSDPIEKGNVSLVSFSTEKNAYFQRAKTITSLSGEYNFNDLKPGTYLILADANNDEYIPTYWGNTAELNDAVEIHIMENNDQDLTGFNITLASNKTFSSYEVGRVVANDTGFQITVLVLDQNNNLVGTTKMDRNGNVNLNGFPPGNYNLLNQQTGNMRPVSVTTNNPTDGNLSPGALAGSITLIPNPAVNHVKFNINITNNDQQVEIMIINGSGATVYQKNYLCTSGAYPFDIDISGLPPGVYYVVVNAGENQTLSGRMIKSSDNSR